MSAGKRPYDMDDHEIACAVPFGGGSLLRVAATYLSNSIAPTITGSRSYALKRPIASAASPKSRPAMSMRQSRFWARPPPRNFCSCDPEMRNTGRPVALALWEHLAGF